MQLLIIIVPVVLIVIGLTISKALKRKCLKCKTKFTYNDIVSASEGGSKVFQGLGLMFTDVNVVCKCPKCQRTKQIKIKFKSGDRKSGLFGDNITVYDLDNKLKKYFS